MQWASSTANNEICTRLIASRKRSLLKRSGATYSIRSCPSRKARITSALSCASSVESIRAAAMPNFWSRSSWSFIRAINGDTTTVNPGSNRAGSW